MLVRQIRSARHCIFGVLLALQPQYIVAGTENLKLPNLGESSTSLFSAEFEHQIGREWLKQFRAQAPLVNDPILQDYLETLLFNLVSHSELHDRRLELVIVDNPTMNAFAVPGGVVGIHNGLFLYAQSEDELASVLAHEIAHLSQRHFSRQIEAAQDYSAINIAGLLAGVLLAVASGSDAGLAAMTATQAAVQDAQLRYSRANEAEADRVGMRTLYQAGLDPYSVPEMFERMMAASRYSSSNRIPEFLRSHPLSENRVSDTRNRAQQYPRRIRPTSLDFQIMRARVMLANAGSPDEGVALFRNQLQGTPTSLEAAQYGLVISLIAAGRASEARLALDALWRSGRDYIPYVIASADIDLALGEPELAVATLRQRLDLSPGNHPLTMAYAHALQQAGNPHIAEQVLTEQARRRPETPEVWYALAEVQGLSGNIIGLHRSRAEFFLLVGHLDAAQEQLEYAMNLLGDDFATSALINERLREVIALKNERG